MSAHLPKTKFTIVIVCVVVVFVFVLDFLIRLDQSPFDNHDAARSLGPANASVQVVEFVDFQCMQCKEGSRLLKDYLNRYPDEIFLTVKLFPLAELNSMVSARYAYCVSLQNKFWPYHDLLFAKQVTWRTLNNVEPYLKSLTKDVGVDGIELQQCLLDKATQKAIFQEKLLGESRFVHTTPTYFINDEMIVGVQELNKKLKELWE